MIRFFNELINAEWHYVELTYIEFRQNLSRNMKSADKNFFMPSSEARLTRPIRTSEPNLITILQRFSLAADNVTDGRASPPHTPSPFFYFVNNA